jgi:hypothetical protein
VAQSYTNIPTHTTGDKLPGADWNAAATIINNGLSTVAVAGTYTSTSATASPPFFVGAEIIDASVNSASELILGIPGGNLPNGLIMVLALPTAYNSSGTSQLGHQCHPDYSNCDKTKITLYCVNQTGGNLTTGTSVRVNVLVIGY